ncbi:MAG TPA: single-stranded DNA-binding protein [Candidatus Binatus sp.]|uniref:single-stranded DNA-binding protein n=1 Tax=Candidatus Binatus sp. TaxID=2811406 RepID=UPI002F3E8CB2
MTGNRIELEGRLLDQPEVRITPAGTPVLRFTVECGAPGEELRLGILMTGESAIAAKQLLEPGRQVKVIGRMRALKGSLKTVGALEVVAESIEQVK